MPYTRPTLAELKDRIIGDIETSVEQKTPVLKRALLRVLGVVFAAAMHILYGFAAWIAKQIIITTAENEYLDRWASIWRVNRKPANYASGPIIAKGVAGSVLPAGSIFVSNSQVNYSTKTEVSFLTEEMTVQVECLSSGTAGNLAENEPLTLTNPVAGIYSDAIVSTGGIAGAVDTEDDESLRQRLLERIQLPPQGGAAHDYVTWALEVATVTRAWCYENHMGIGTVGVTFVCDNLPDMIPTQSKINEVAAHIESVRPLCADVYVFAPIKKSLNFTITVTPNLAEVKTSIESDLRAFIRENGIPNAVIPLSHINEVISLAAGEYDHILTSPVVDIEIAESEIAELGTITWGS